MSVETGIQQGRWRRSAGVKRKRDIYEETTGGKKESFVEGVGSSGSKQASTGQQGKWAQGKEVVIIAEEGGAGFWSEQATLGLLAKAIGGRGVGGEGCRLGR